MPIDRDDKKTGWTVQQGSLAEVDPEVNEPGMKYHRSQLPDPDVAKAAGFMPQPEPADVFDDADEAVKDPNGPSADELHWVDVKNDVKDVVTDIEDALKGDEKDQNKDNDVNTDPVPAADKPDEAVTDEPKPKMDAPTDEAHPSEDGAAS